MQDEIPIALEAYEKLADSFSALAESKAENAFIEQPAIRDVIGQVKGLHILDAGCGPGILAKYLLSQGASSITAFDLSPKMINLARQRVGNSAILHIADLSKNLTFANEKSFDLVVSSLAIDYVKNWHRPLSEFRRVLKPDGRLIFSIQHPLGAYEYYKPPTAFGVQLVQATWKSFGGEPVLVPDYYRSFAEVINPLLENGFQLLRLVESRPIPELREKDPVRYEWFRDRPTFLVVEAKI